MGGESILLIHRFGLRNDKFIRRFPRVFVLPKHGRLLICRCNTNQIRHQRNACSISKPGADCELTTVVLFEAVPFQEKSIFRLPSNTLKCLLPLRLKFCFHNSASGQ